MPIRLEGPFRFHPSKGFAIRKGHHSSSYNALLLLLRDFFLVIKKDATPGPHPPCSWKEHILKIMYLLACYLYITLLSSKEVWLRTSGLRAALQEFGWINHWSMCLIIGSCLIFSCHIIPLVSYRPDLHESVSRWHCGRGTPINLTKDFPRLGLKMNGPPMRNSSWIALMLSAPSTWTTRIRRFIGNCKKFWITGGSVSAMSEVSTLLTRCLLPLPLDSSPLAFFWANLSWQRPNMMNIHAPIDFELTHDPMISFAFGFECWSWNTIL